MLKNIQLLLFFFILLGSSCSDRNELPELPLEEEDQEVSEDKNPYITGVDLSTSKSIHWEKNWAQEPFFMLGYGYDVTGKYAHPAFIRGKVINMTKYHEDNASQLNILRANSGSYGLSVRGTDKEWIKTIAERAGFTAQEVSIYKNLFSKTFEASFDDDTSFPDLPYYFLGTSDMLVSSLIEFNYPKHRKEWFLNNYLTDEFRNDVNTKPAEEIIKIYGTHLLTDIKVGQRIDYVYRYAEDKASSSDDWFLYNMRQYFQGMGFIGDSKPTIISPLKENMYVEVVDGAGSSPNAWMLDITNYEKERIQFDGWNKITEEHLTLVDFWRRDRPLTPIYEFVEDEGRKKALIAAYQKYLGGV